MTREEADRVAGLNIPHANSLVTRASKYICRVWVEGQGIHIVEMPCEYPQWVDMIAGPKPSGMVMTRGRKVMAERPEFDIPDGIVVAFVYNKTGICVK